MAHSSANSPISDNLDLGLWYSWQLGETESNQLTIDTKGNLTGFILFSADGMPLQALGAYYRELGWGDPDMARIRSQAMSLIDQSDSWPSMRPFPGMRRKTFSIRIGDKQMVKHLNAIQPLPKPFAEMEQTIFRLFDKLRENPMRTLAVAVAFEPNPVRATDSFRMNVSFRNDGKFPVEFRNPCAFRAGGANTFRLDFWTKEQDAGGKAEDHLSLSLNLGGREFLVQPRKSVGSETTNLRLAPGQVLQAYTIMPFPKLRPGHYQCTLVYSTTPVSREELKVSNDLTAGMFQGSPVPLEVRPAPSD